jgi:hypothetical protein
MTPEEQLHAMSDEGRWQLEPFRPSYSPRRTVVAPRARPWVVAFTTAATVIVATAVVLGVVMWRGDVPAPIATLAPTPSVSPSPTTPVLPATNSPSPTETPVLPGADGSRPEQVLDGSCTTVLSRSEAEAVIGGAVNWPYTDDSFTQRAYDVTRTLLYGPDYFSVIEHGGIDCRWDGDHVDGSVYLIAAPSGAGPAVADANCGSAGRDGAFYTCAVEYTSHGIRYSGGVEAISSSVRTAIAHRLFTRLRAIPEAPRVVAPVYPSGTWAPISDCADVARALSATRGKKYVAIGPGSGNFSESDYSALRRSLVADTIGSTTGCYVSQSKNESGVAVNFYPGGAWMTPVLLDAGATKTSIPGFDAAYSLPGGDGDPAMLYLFSGVNVATIQTFDSQTLHAPGAKSSYVAAMRSIVSALDTHPR